MTTFFLVRHGQSVWNAEGRWQGQADPALSDLGRSQAREAGQTIGQVDLIVSSPQIRALETATLIGDAIGIGPVIAVDGLKERSAGSWSGLTAVEIEEQYPGWLAAGRRPDDFEPSDALEKRVLGTLNELATTYEDAMVLVVCHGGVIHSVEETFGHVEGRVPNLGGRVVHANTTDWSLGDRLVLVQETTGGTSSDSSQERL